MNREKHIKMRRPIFDAGYQAAQANLPRRPPSSYIGTWKTSVWLEGYDRQKEMPCP